MEFRVRRELAAVRIDAERGREIPGGNGVTDLASDRDRPDPRERVGQIAEAFAEIDGRDVVVEGLGADGFAARPAPLDGESR